MMNCTLSERIIWSTQPLRLLSFDNIIMLKTFCFAQIFYFGYFLMLRNIRQMSHQMNYSKKICITLQKIVWAARECIEYINHYLAPEEIQSLHLNIASVEIVEMCNSNSPLGTIILKRSMSQFVCHWIGSLFFQPIEFKRNSLLIIYGTNAVA